MPYIFVWRFLMPRNITSGEKTGLIGMTIMVYYQLGSFKSRSNDPIHILLLAQLPPTDRHYGLVSRVSDQVQTMPN
jgi:hypothetical protein